MSDPREVLAEIQRQAFRGGGPVTSRDGKRLFFASVTAPESHFDALVAALTAVLDLHKRPRYESDWCASCSHVWPCPTVRAITEALGADNVARTDPEMPNGGPCPTCGKQVALPLLEGHLELHRTRGVDR